MKKSYVGMAYHVCPVCGTEHDPAVLLDRRMRNTLTDHEFAGWQMCPEHQKLKDGGYVAMIEVSNKPTGMANALRTGQIAHVRSEAWPKIFNSPVPPAMVAFAEVGLFAQLQEQVEDRHIMALAESRGH